MPALPDNGEESAGDNVPGVSAIRIDLDKKAAIVTYNPDKAQPESLTDVITNVGYSPTLQE